MSILECVSGAVTLVSAVSVTGLVLLSKAGGRGLSGAIGGGENVNRGKQIGPEKLVERAIGISSFVCGLSVFVSALASAHF